MNHRHAMKKCRACKQEMSLDHFPKHRTSVDGHMAECKACRGQEVAAPRKARDLFPAMEVARLETKHEMRLERLNTQYRLVPGEEER